MPKVTIDNIEIEVPEGTTILQAARMIGERNVAERYVVPPTIGNSGDTHSRHRSHHGWQYGFS